MQFQLWKKKQSAWTKTGECSCFSVGNRWTDAAVKCVVVKKKCRDLGQGWRSRRILQMRRSKTAVRADCACTLLPHTSCALHLGCRKIAISMVVAHEFWKRSYLGGGECSSIHSELWQLSLWIVSKPPCLVTSDNLVKKILVIFEHVQIFHWLSFNVSHFEYEYIFQKVTLTLVTQSVLHKNIVVQC